MHELSSLPGKATDETPGKGRNQSWQPHSLEIPSAVPAKRHFKDVFKRDVHTLIILSLLQIKPSMSALECQCCSDWAVS